MSKKDSGDNFATVGYRRTGSIEWWGTAEEAFAFAVQQTAELGHLHQVIDRAGNIVSPEVVA